MAVNIYDVAQRAGVSISTVSRVINNPELVSKKNVEKVEKVMEELDFIPSGIARSLTVRSTRSIGVIVADITNPYYAELLLSIQDAANEIGYSIISCNSHEDMDKERRLIQTLLEKKVDLIMMVGGRGAGPGYDDQVIDLAQKIPVILCNEYIEHEDLFCVVCDKRKGAWDAVQYLHSLGHRRIAFINGGDAYRPSQQKLKGYREALETLGLPVREEYIKHGNYHIEGGYNEIESLMALEEPPTAILTSNDLMAMGAIKALTRCSRRVPEDVSVCGFDDIFICTYYNPEITSVSQQMAELGKKAVELIPEVLAGTAPRKTVIEPVLQIRETCRRI